MDIAAATKRIDSLVDGLLSLKKELIGDAPVIPQTTIDRKSRNQCVSCGKSLRGEKTPWRGCHSKCAQAVNRRIKAGKLTDRDAIKSGEWGPADEGGRPTQVSSKPAAEELTDDEIAAIDRAADQAYRDDAKKKKAKTTRTKKRNAG